MTDLKTKPTDNSVDAFISQIEDSKRKEDLVEVKKMIEAITGEKPKMWGPSMIGYGEYHYKYDSGREGDWFITGLSPRKQALTVYLMAGLEKFDSYIGKLGKYTTGKSCLYIKRLEDIDKNTLKKLLEENYRMMASKKA